MEEANGGGPYWGNLVYLLHPSSLAMIGTATGTVMAAALRASRHDVDMHQSGVPPSEAAVTLDHKQALAIPIFSSCALLTLFYFFKSIQLFLLLILCIAASVGIVFTMHPLLQFVMVGKPALRRRLVLCSTWHVQLGEALLAAAAGVTVTLWLLTGSMALNNVLGICLAIAFISFVRLPSLKVTTYLLSALFFYDIFWVFFSSRLFGSNVMVEAATKQAENPAVALATALHLPSGALAQRLDLPVKLLFPENLLHWDRLQPSVMLGLGDIALPGMLIALLICEDIAKWQAQQSHSTTGGGTLVSSRKSALRSWQFWRHSYVLPSWIGYCVGMFVSFGIGCVFEAAQPALLYLVPATLSPALVRARKRKELLGLWEGWELEKAERKEACV